NHHLYWKTVDGSLSNRKLTVVDPSTSQHQKLMLIDPDKLSGAAGLSTMTDDRDAAAAASDDEIDRENASGLTGPKDIQE
ncbi:hypothetical protein OAH18_03360, partial [bacterium]|nr:hypothetical protein [bacterium]